MSLAQFCVAAAAMSALAAFGAALVLPRRARVGVTGFLTAVIGASGAGAGAAVLASGRSVNVRWREVLPLSRGLVLHLDPLGALFLVAIGIVVTAAAVYGIGYAQHAVAGRCFQAALPLFALSMLVVPAAGNVTTLLFAWELMALTSLVLVAAEHRERAAVRDAVRWYGVMTHLGFVAILLALVGLAAHSGGETFSQLRDGAVGMSPAWRSLVFVLAVIGFGSKAGMVPLHVWLPRTHPEAPSHISALMSGAMVSVGVYGIVRVGVDLLGGGPRWWGILLLALGSVSALFGVLHALVSSDLKVLLAYSTTENVGLMLIGVGAALLLGAEHERVLAGVALAAALLLVVNHAVFKGLLFLGAGSVLRATGTRDLDRLGGLMHRMPATGALFAVGAFAIAGLPPLNGFVSEWTLLQVLVRGGSSHVAVLSVALPIAVGVVALTAGLAAATFVKALGTGFLALPRSEAAAGASESPVSMRAGMGLLAGLCVVLGLVPGVLAGGLGRAVSAAGLSTTPVRSVDGEFRLADIGSVMTPGLLALLLVAAIVAVLAVWRVTGAARARRSAENWGCGRALQTARMEYTATSFAEPLQRVFDDVIRPDHDVNVTHATESRWYVEAIRYRHTIHDAFERRLYEPLARAFAAWGGYSRRLQNGSVHRYLGYGFVAFVVAMVVAR